MRRPVALLLIVAGVALVAVGLSGAVAHLGGLYGGASGGPLDEPEVDERARADAMFRSALIGAGGVPVLGAGVALLRFGGRRSRR